MTASADLTAARKKLLSQITVAQKKADSAKKAARQAKVVLKVAKQKAKEAKRTARKLRKEAKALKAELAALVAKKRPVRKAAAKPVPAKRDKPAVPAAVPVIPDVSVPSQVPAPEGPVTQ